MSTTQTKRWVRKQLIALAQRRQRPGAGSALAFLTERSADVVYPDFSGVFRGLAWAVVGAAATRLYMPERVTRDFDVLILSANGPEARRRLRSAGLSYQGELAFGGSSWLTAAGMAVDILEMDAAWLPQALTEAQSNRDAQDLPVLPLPYLVLMKFQAGRVQDLADVTRMLGQANDEALEAVRRLFREHASDDLDDLESLTVLGQMELRGPEQRRSEGGDGPSGR